MAGDWIKVEKSTARKPEVLRIAAALDIHPDHAFGICFRFWTWCDDNIKDGVLRMTSELIDSVVDRSGFAVALVTVGWLHDRDGALEIPNFDRHMSHAAKNRLASAERQRKSRSEKVTQVSHDVTKCHKDTIPRPLRKSVYDRDNSQCVYCGWTEKDTVPFGPYLGATLSLDHVIPESKGGETKAHNIVTCCSVCNNVKNNRTPHEAGMVAKYVTKMCDKVVTKALPREEKRREDIDSKTINACENENQNTDYHAPRAFCINPQVTAIAIGKETIEYHEDAIRWEAEFVRRWNDLPGVSKRTTASLDSIQRQNLTQRLMDSTWDWKQAFMRFPIQMGLTFVPSLSWFLKPDTVSKILDGAYRVVERLPMKTAAVASEPEYSDFNEEDFQD